MMKKIKYLLIIITIGFFSNCDIVEPPYIEENNYTPQQDSVVRKVLLEEFTGIKCPNCPEATVVAHDLKAYYGEKLILATIHAGWFATPDASGNYTDDLRSSAGEDLHTFFGIAGNPIGMINRHEYSGNKLQTHGDWSSCINQLIDESIIAFIKIGNTWNSIDKTVAIDIETEFYQTDANTYNLCVFLLEDSIITWQQNDNASVGTTPDIENYVHMHVLRDAVNSTWGDTIVNGGASVGLISNKQYIYNFNSHPDFIPGNCSIIAFVYDISTKEIVQAQEKKIF